MARKEVAALGRSDVGDHESQAGAARQAAGATRYGYGAVTRIPRTLGDKSSKTRRVRRLSESRRRQV